MSADEAEDGELVEEGEISDSEEILPPPPKMPNIAGVRANATEYNNGLASHNDGAIKKEPRDNQNNIMKEPISRKYRDYDPKEQTNGAPDAMISSWMSSVKSSKAQSATPMDTAEIDANAEYYGFHASASTSAASVTKGKDQDYRMESSLNSFGDRDYRARSPSRKRRRSGGALTAISDEETSQGRQSADLDVDLRMKQRSPGVPHQTMVGGHANQSMQYPPPRIVRGGRRMGLGTDRLLCKFYREGFCRDGDNCTYSHSIGDGTRQHELCKFYQQGFCKKNWVCPFLHGEWPCKQFHREGNCTREHCKFSHAVLDEYSKPIFELQLQRDEEIRRHRAATGAGGPPNTFVSNKSVHAATPSAASSQTPAAPTSGTEDEPELETLPSKRVVLLNTPISQRADMNVLDFLDYLSGGRLFWIADTPAIPPGYPPGMAPPVQQTATPCSTTDTNYMPPPISAMAPAPGVTPSQQGPLLATPNVMPTQPPPTLHPYMQQQIQHPPPPPPSGLPPVPIPVALAVIPTAPNMSAAPPLPVNMNMAPQSVAPGPLGTTYDQTQTTQPMNVPAPYVNRTARTGNMGLPATIGVGLLPAPSMPHEQAVEPPAQAEPQPVPVKEEPVAESSPAPAPTASVTYDINEMLRRIRENSQQVKAEHIAEEPEESPASPPAAAPSHSHGRMPVNIPSQDMPVYRLVLVDVPNRPLLSAHMLSASLNDTKLRNDPRVKKLLEGQFNAVTNMISSASQGAAAEPEKSASEAAPSSSSSNIPSIVQNPYKPIDPRSVAPRDPRSRPPERVPSTTNTRGSADTGTGWMPSLAAQAPVDQSEVMQPQAPQPPPSYMPQLPNIKAELGLNSSPNGTSRSPPPPRASLSSTTAAIQRDPRMAKPSARWAAQNQNGAEAAAPAPTEQSSAVPLSLREKRANLQYESPLGGRGNRYNQSAGVRVVRKATGTSPTQAH